MLRTLLIGVLCLGMALAQFCRPEEDCWPSKDLIMELGKSLKGNIVMPSDSDYKNLTAMKNTLETKSPAFVVLPKETKDVQKAIIFAVKHNIQLKIFSSGHSYVGRSTGNGTMMINFAKMKKITPYPGASVPFITVQPGVNWGQVYKEADKVKHIVVGGSAQTVSPSGCTLGGCHSPMSRMLGLAADNVLAYTAVTANGSIVQMTKRDKMGTVEDRYGKVSRVDTSDLFWALRGGGGAFAILTNITFKMHKPPKGFVRVVCSWKYDVAREFLNHYNAKVEKLPPQWGGYLLFQNRASLGDSAGVIMAMLHFGPWNSPTTAAIQQLTDFMPESRQYCFPVNYTTFYEYEKNINDPTGFRTNIYNRFLGKGHFTTGLTSSLVNQFESADYYKLPFGCTWTHIGGTVSEQPANSTAVGPDFRNALVSLSCGPAWTEKKDDEAIGRFMRAFGADLHKYGRGVYYNEPGRYLKNFTEEFWRGKYGKLLSIKKKWDPKNLFTCFQCVDSGKGPNATKLTMWLTTLTLALALLF